MQIQQTLSFEITSSADKKPSSLVFEQLVNQTIDDVFSPLGAVCKQAVYDYLEKKYGLRKDDIANHISEFSEAIEQVFGSAAALLEIRMMKRFFRKVPKFKHWPEEMLTFPGYVNALLHFVSTH